MPSAVVSARARVREILTNFLLAICEKNERYLKFMNDDAVDKLPAAGGLVLAASVEEMATNGATKASSSGVHEALAQGPGLCAAHYCCVRSAC